MNDGQRGGVALEVLDPGFFTTIQDAGRPDWTHLGVPVGGACDAWSLAVANVLAGNEPGAAALEMTIIGPELAVRSTSILGLAGADLGAVVRGTGERLAPGRSHLVAGGTTIAFPGAEEPTAGARGYLAIAGGVDVPGVLGSASTLVSAGIGGLEGHPLRAGDVVRARRTAAGAPSGPRTWPGDPGGTDPGRPIGVLPGNAPGIGQLVDATWSVAAASDRVGLRLEGPGLASAGRGELLSHGVVRGAIQLPPDGAPIVLLADHQTTGGYPVIAIVMTADHPRLGQLRPGARVRFREVTPEEARAALLDQRAAFDRAASALRDAARWDELWRSAGG
jgi:antagonist of KipI